MKFNKLLARISIIVFLAAVVPLTGCAALPLMYGCQYCCYSIRNSGTRDSYAFGNALSNYTRCAFVDEEKGVKMKLYDRSYYAWGSVEVDGSPRCAYYYIYGDGETYIYLPESESDFSVVLAARIMLAFDGGYIVCKSVKENNLNLNLENLKLKYVRLEPSDFLPHERGFYHAADENRLLQISRLSSNAYYSCRARTVENGYIKTYDGYFRFLDNDVFEIYEIQTKTLLSSGTYTVVDDNTVNLKFGQKDNLFASRPFDSYPYLTVSRSYYAGSIV